MSQLPEFDINSIIPTTGNDLVEQAIQSNQTPQEIQPNETTQVVQGGKPWFELLDKTQPSVMCHWVPEKGAWEIVIHSPPENPLDNRQRNLLFRALTIANRRQRAQVGFSNYKERLADQRRRQAEVDAAIAASKAAGTYK